MSETVYTAKDYKSGQPRWCPGCGDHAFLNSLHKAMAELGVAPHNIAGSPVSAVLPAYLIMSTHTASIPSTGVPPLLQQVPR